MKYFEDLAVGDRWTHMGSYEVTAEEIMEVGRRWDPQVFHTDPEAAKDSFFGGLVASTVHMFAIMTAIGQKVSEEHRIAAVSALGLTNMKMHAPTRPGDVITSTIHVLETRLSSSRPELGILRNGNDLHNQRDELVFSSEAALLVERRPE